MRLPRLITPEIQQRAFPTGRLVALVGGVVLIVAPFLPWAYSSRALDNMTVLGYPSPLQIFALILGVFVVGLIAIPMRLKPARRRLRVGWIRGAKAAATGSLIYVALILISIAAELGGLVNVVYGGWVALLGALAAFVGTRLMLVEQPANLMTAVAKPWLEILAVAAMMGLILFALAFALNNDDAGTFVSFIAFIGTVLAVLVRVGVMGWLSAVSQRHKRVLILAAFVVAFAFPFTQGGSDANMSIATQVIIFAAAAMGLNIVVGLAGLLDLGYIAFLVLVPSLPPSCLAPPSPRPTSTRPSSWWCSLPGLCRRPWD